MRKIKRDRLEQAAEYIAGWLDFNWRDSRLPGIVVAIQHDDDLVFNQACGYADAVNKTKLTSGHVFRIASQSKTFTATAIFQLYEASKLRLDDPVSSHLDWFVSPKDKEVAKITIRHLLNHTSGLIRDGLDANYWRLGRDFPDRAELKDFVKNSKLQTLKTSQYFKYSNYAYSYLGLVIEAASQMTYEDYMAKNVIGRLGLNDTYPDLSPQAEKKLARGHTPILFNHPRQLVDHIDTRGMAAATGFCSTAGDLCQYFSAHCHGNDRLLSDAAKREMQHGSWPTGSSGESYGLGLRVYRYGQNTLIGHSGSFPGFKTDSRFEPHQKLVVSVLTNAWDGFASFVAERIVNIVNSFNTSEGRIKNTGKYEGRFFDAWGIMDVVGINGRLVATSPVMWGDFEAATPLELVAENRLRLEKKNSSGSTGEEIIYNFGPAGEVKSIISGGIKMLPEKDYLKLAGLE